MKTYAVKITTIACVFSFSCFAQRATSNTSVIAPIANAHTQSDNQSGDDLVLDYYHVEETINMSFGRRTTKYDVSKLDMVNTYDLGPNNTRTVTPVYRKAKVKPTEIGMLSKTVKDTVSASISPVKVAVIAPSQKAKYLTVNRTKTYMQVVDKGYASSEMLKKVADQHYFDGEMSAAAKYYAQLIEMSPDIEASYYYRYAQSLKEIGQTEKANEMMVLFESKNMVKKIAKE
jgi:tetratricopeptide (TPR) repeat protein